MSAGRDDIRVATGFLQHVKIRRLRRELGADAVLSLLQLWCYAAENHQDGVLGSPSDVEEASDWSGEAGALLDALKRLHLLEDDGVTIHDWTHEQPWVVSKPKRVARAKHAASMRWACPEQCPPSPSPTPTPTQPEQPSSSPPASTPAPKSRKPPDPLIAKLALKIGQPKKWCQEPIAVLKARGWDSTKIAEAIDTHGDIGDSTQKWLKVVAGNGSPTTDRFAFLNDPLPPRRGEPGYVPK